MLKNWSGAMAAGEWAVTLSVVRGIRAKAEDDWPAACK